MLNFERIELLGFKSFADKVSIDLLDGITGIVGPNGCGKSNVADAIRWVLGEQSAKQLRGGSMQDVIFNGTQSRKSLSYCEVSLYFNNTNKVFPSLEYEEVVFTRKLFRSGESEYYLNKQECRLKDIVDLLHECGVSKEGYTIIGQGKVSEILSSKPEDRRAIFEEAVGIAKTKKDRKETLNRIERINDNITRVSDIITERERQLKPLSDQAEKTRKYRDFSEKLKYHEINTYLYKFDNASDTKKKISDKIQGYSEAVIARNNELNDVVKAYNEKNEKLNGLDENLREVNQMITEKAVNIEKQTGEAKVFGEKIAYFKRENERLDEEIKSCNSKTEELKYNLKVQKDFKAKSEKEKLELESKSGEISKKLLELNEEIRIGESKVRSVQRQVLSSAESLADINKNIGALSGEENAISDRQKTVTQKLNELIGKIAAVTLEKENNEKALAEVEEKYNSVKEQIALAESKISEINGEISATNQKIYSLNEKLVSADAGLKFYTNVKSSYENYNISIQNLFKASKQNKEVEKRIIDTVASIIRTDRKYETAISIALGSSAQNVLTESSDDATYLVKFMKSEGLGRITCLPLDSIRGRMESGDIIDAKREKGAYGLATELVQFDKKYVDVVKMLLGNTLIVEDEDCANQIFKKYRNSFKIITLGGAVYSSSGAITGGSLARHEEGGLLSVDRKLGEYQEALNRFGAEKNKLEEENKKALEKVNAKVEELDKLNSELDELKRSSSDYREKITVEEEIISSLKSEAEQNEGDIAAISARLDAIKREYSEKQADTDKILKSKAEASSDEQKHQEYFDKIRSSRDELLDENTKIQTELASIKSEIEACISEIERINKELDDLAKKSANDEILIQNNEKIIESIKLEAEKVTLSDEERKELEDLRSKLDEFEKTKEMLNEDIKQLNLKRDVLQEDINKNTDRKNLEEINLAKVDSDLEHMAENIFNEYQVTYETCQVFRDENYDISLSGGEIQSLKRSISSLGSINPNAIEEYNELNESYQELVTQRDDLYKAQEDLLKVVNDLTSDMTVAFDEGFKKIRTNFTKIFKELFGGGTADLIIEESQTEDPLDAGIEIVAEPPGKKLQKISLLSGGEMSLTAIAILFAILKLRPMPFCVLDEIEAALDDANVERFANYLRKFSQETQFICITHKKVTMEKADGLFGVTMPEKGVSSIVSVKLADIENTELLKDAK